LSGEEQLRDPKYVKARGVLEGIDLFDAAFFGYTPREAEVMDPQQRVFLECAWEALENAGYDPQRYPGPIGVYAGAGMSTYLQLVTPTPWRRSAGSRPSGATRTSCPRVLAAEPPRASVNANGLFHVPGRRSHTRQGL
jgi:acyl transferase domain-containing protein